MPPKVPAWNARACRVQVEQYGTSSLKTVSAAATTRKTPLERCSWSVLSAWRPQHGHVLGQCAPANGISTCIAFSSSDHRASSTPASCWAAVLEDVALQLAAEPPGYTQFHKYRDFDSVAAIRDRRRRSSRTGRSSVASHRISSVAPHRRAHICKVLSAAVAKRQRTELYLGEALVLRSMRLRKRRTAVILYRFRLGSYEEVRKNAHGSSRPAGIVGSRCDSATSVIRAQWLSFPRSVRQR
jgi:hypothetical protein